MVEKKFVVVALVEVELVELREEIVVEAVEMNPVNVGVPVKAGETDPTTTPVPPVSSVRRANSSADVSIDVEEILLLKMFQSAKARHPKIEAEAVSQSMSLRVRVRPSPNVRGTW